MKKLDGKTALVTGAASGIGRCIALALSEEGCNLALVDRNEQGLDEVMGRLNGNGRKAKAFAVDLTDEGSVDELAEQVSPDLLVNCAGVTMMAEIENTSPRDWEWLLGVNLLAPIRMVRAFLPSLKSRGEAHIVNVASGAGLYTIPTLGAYSTTKFALVGYSETIAAELARYGIKVTTVCPGATFTPITRAQRKGFDSSRVDTFLRWSRPLIFTTPEKLAAAIVTAVKKDRPILVHTWLFKLLHFMKRLSPRLTARFQYLVYMIAFRFMNIRRSN